MHSVLVKSLLVAATLTAIVLLVLVAIDNRARGLRLHHARGACWLDANGNAIVAANSQRPNHQCK